MNANEQRLSFGKAAAHYDSIRPTYPAEALEWLLGAEPPTVVDLGAGTGIFSRVLGAAGHHVIAVEPDPLMRDRLVAVSPHITTVPSRLSAMLNRAPAVTVMTLVASAGTAI